MIPSEPSQKEDLRVALLEKSLKQIINQDEKMKNFLSQKNLLQGANALGDILLELRAECNGGSDHLTPKLYYNLYKTILESSLKPFYTYICDVYLTHSNPFHVPDVISLLDLYTHVQKHQRSVLSRIYMMIAIGTVIILALYKVKKSNNADPHLPENLLILQDFMEMCKGIQHPIHGLFARHYLNTMIKDLLPGKLYFSETQANLEASILILLENFREQNCLWVRHQYIGQIEDRITRYNERKELKVLIGANLMRISQLFEDVVHKEEKERKAIYNLFITKVLSGVLAEAVACHEQLSQHYLIETILDLFDANWWLPGQDITSDHETIHPLQQLVTAFSLFESDSRVDLLFVKLLGIIMTHIHELNQQPEGDQVELPDVFSLLFPVLEEFAKKKVGQGVEILNAYQLVYFLTELVIKLDKIKKTQELKHLQSIIQFLMDYFTVIHVADKLQKIIIRIVCLMISSTDTPIRLILSDEMDRLIQKSNILTCEDRLVLMECLLNTSNERLDNSASSLVQLDDTQISRILHWFLIPLSSSLEMQQKSTVYFARFITLFQTKDGKLQVQVLRRIYAYISKLAPERTILIPMTIIPLLSIGRDTIIASFLQQESNLDSEERSSLYSWLTSRLLSDIQRFGHPADAFSQTLAMLSIFKHIHFRPTTSSHNIFDSKRAMQRPATKFKSSIHNDDEKKISSWLEELLVQLVTLYENPQGEESTYSSFDESTQVRFLKNWVQQLENVKLQSFFCSSLDQNQMSVQSEFLNNYIVKIIALATRLLKKASRISVCLKILHIINALPCSMNHILLLNGLAAKIWHWIDTLPSDTHIQLLIKLNFTLPLSFCLLELDAQPHLNQEGLFSFVKEHTCPSADAIQATIKNFPQDIEQNDYLQNIDATEPIQNKEFKQRDETDNALDGIVVMNNHTLGRSQTALLQDMTCRLNHLHDLLEAGSANHNQRLAVKKLLFMVSPINFPQKEQTVGKVVSAGASSINTESLDEDQSGDISEDIANDPSSRICEPSQSLDINLLVDLSESLKNSSIKGSVHKEAPRERSISPNNDKDLEHFQEDENDLPKRGTIKAEVCSSSNNPITKTLSNSQSLPLHHMSQHDKDTLFASPFSS